jgi:molybdopterin-guanine dinucleotide biosynthesis protein A
MISKEHNLPADRHKKHTSLARPISGSFGRNEWAIVGAPCTNIKLLAADIIAALSPQYKCAYADASHNDELTQLPGRLASGAVLEYTDQINHHQFNFTNQLTPIRFKQQFADADLVLVNGNHQAAKAQVVIIHNNKIASLQKRVEQLTNVGLILLADADDVFDFIKEAIPNCQQIPTYRLDETEKIISFFKNQMQQAKPVLNGLVLAGGQSIRMGLDKGAINWYGKEQRYHLADLLKQHCNEVFISCRADQQAQITEEGYKTLPDTFTGLGPYGAILSAFREQPDSAWLVVACDMPLVDANTFAHLISNRNISSLATTYQSAFNDFPEPLITIWEPKSYPVLLAFLAQGYSCPRKVLINSDCNIVKPLNADVLSNVNTPEDYDKIKRQIHQKIASA